MSGYSRSDLFEFDEAALKDMVALFNEIILEMNSTKSQFLETIENLSTVWTTTGGVYAVEKLKSFNEVDITNLITYLNERVSDLEYVLGELPKIDQA